MVNLLLLLIQEGVLSVKSESMCMEYWLTALSSLPRKSVIRCIDCCDMTIAVDWDVKPPTVCIIKASNLIFLHVNNIVTDQPQQPRAFVIRFLRGLIVKLVTSKFKYSS